MYWKWRTPVPDVPDPEVFKPAVIFTNSEFMNKLNVILDVDRLESIKLRFDGLHMARCPACAEEGADRTANNLLILRNGDFACSAYPRYQRIQHRQRILSLVGIDSPCPCPEVTP